MNRDRQEKTQNILMIVSAQVPKKKRRKKHNTKTLKEPFKQIGNASKKNENTTRKVTKKPRKTKTS